MPEDIKPKAPQLPEGCSIDPIDGQFYARIRTGQESELQSPKLATSDLCVEWIKNELKQK